MCLGTGLMKLALPAYQPASLFVWAQVILRPVENTVVSFRGDACHRVERFSSAKGTARVSLVVEQYRLKPREMARMLPLTSSVAFDGIDFD